MVRKWMSLRTQKQSFLNIKAFLIFTFKKLKELIDHWNILFDDKPLWYLANNLKAVQQLSKIANTKIFIPICLIPCS